MRSFATLLFKSAHSLPSEQFKMSAASWTGLLRTAARPASWTAQARAPLALRPNWVRIATQHRNLSQDARNKIDGVRFHLHRLLFLVLSDQPLGPARRSSTSTRSSSS